MSLSATNASGTRTAEVMIQIDALRITTQPSSQTVLFGTNVTFSVGTVSAAPAAYQWRKNGVDLSRGTYHRIVPTLMRGRRKGLLAVGASTRSTLRLSG